MEHYQLLILGGGPAGYVAAIRAARENLKVALVEKSALGGLCLNQGCIPSKSLLASAELLEKIKEAKNFGIAGIDGKAATADWPVMMKRANRIVGRLTRGVAGLLAKAGVTVIEGLGELTDTKTCQVGKQKITFDNLLIATGASYPHPKWAEAGDDFKTAATIYEIAALPKEMVIIGAGVSGLEFAGLFSMLGVKVTVVEKNKKLMTYLDDDLASFLDKMLKKRKITVLTGQTASGWKKGVLTTDSEEGTQTINADLCLYAPRRTANLQGLEPLLKAGMELKNGYIRTDLRTRTTLPNVYAAGDVNGLFMLAHVASKEGLTAVETILNKGRDILYDMMPYNMYSTPEIASVGLTEKAALAKGLLVSTGTFPLTANGKALASGDPDGFIKIVFEKKYKEILGIHMAASHATDLIGEGVLAMSLESTLEELGNLTHPHPTLVETLTEASWKGLGTEIHM
jgi:dihydrolipoamide dehydrogenase